MDSKKLYNNSSGVGVRSDLDCFCLICCSTTSNAVIRSGIACQNENLFNQEQVIFILKHILQLPSSQLEEYLKAYGNPDQWFNLCDECTQLTVKARELYLQLLKIEKQLKEIQRKILNVVKSDSKTSELYNQYHYQHPSLNSKLLIWQETRSFVNNESYQNLFLNIKQEPSFEEPERLTTPTSSPPPFPPSDDYDSSVSSSQVKEEFDDADPDVISNSYDDDNSDNYIPSPSSSPPPSPAPKKDKLLTCDICGKTAFSSRGSLSCHRIRFHKAWKIGPHNKRRKNANRFDNLKKRPNDTPEKCTNDKVTQPTPIKNGPKRQLFPCPLCSLTFRFGSKWQSHLQTVHQSEELPCFMENCNRKFYILRNFLSHLTVHLTGIDFVCPHCPPGKVFPNRGTLNHHIKLKHNPDGPPPKPDISQLTCEICGSSKFSSTHSLAIHRLKVHKFWKRGPKRKYGKAQSLEAAPQEKHLCELCGSIFKSKDRLNGHIKLSHDKCFPVHCHLCGKGTTSPNELKVHIVRWHKEEAEKEGLQLFTCQIEGCTRYYLSKEQFDKHFREHHGVTDEGDSQKDKPYKCKECEKSFFWKGRLVKHEMTHKNKGLKCYQCKFCDKGYPMSEYLKRHLRVKHGIKCKKGEGAI